MTKSSQSMDKIAGRPKWTSTEYQCEECKGKIVQLGQNDFSCTICGLRQQRLY